MIYVVSGLALLGAAIGFGLYWVRQVDKAIESLGGTNQGHPVSAEDEERLLHGED